MNLPANLLRQLVIELKASTLLDLVTPNSHPTLHAAFHAANSYCQGRVSLPRNTFTQDISLTMPDESEITIKVNVTATHESNPYDKPRAHYHKEDDGWNVEDIEIA